MIVEHTGLDSPSRAEAFQWEALEASLLLERDPKAVHPVAEVGDPNIRELQFGNYRVIHWVKSAGEVVVLTNRHGKRKLARALVIGRKRSYR